MRGRPRQTHCKHGHEFTPANTYIWRRQRVCRACGNRRSKNRTRDVRTAWQRKKLYGITPAEFDARLAAQGGLCAICKTEAPTSVDHDHVYGDVRGLLCHRCNILLGYLEKTPRDVLERAEWYILSSHTLERITAG